MVISLAFRFPSKVIIHSLNVEKYQIKREGGDMRVCKCEFSGVCCTLPPPSPRRFPIPVSFSPLRNLTGREFSCGGVEAALFELLFTQKSQLAVRNRHLFLSGLTRLRGSPSISFKEPAVPRAQLCGPLGCDLCQTHSHRAGRESLVLVQMGLLRHMPAAPPTP